jgi:hypothetical protein
MAKLPALPVWKRGAGDGDYSIGPDYAPAPEQTKRAGVPEGKVVEFVINSAESKFYPGVNGPFQRHVCVYVPAKYVPGTAHRLSCLLMLTGCTTTCPPSLTT